MSNCVITDDEYILDDSKKIIGYENLDSMIEFLINVVESSSEFKRLEDKAQVIFTRGAHPKIKNRLSHTKDVASISQKLAEKSNFPSAIQRLAYLIGMCHDLGHTAFGHVGESRIDAALKYYNVSISEFDEKFYDGEEPGARIEYKEPGYSFEHHAHSVRVFKKILKDNNIELSKELSGDIFQGILCHSESRTKDSEVRKPIWALARYADKIYAYTDMLDVLNTGVTIDVDTTIDDINSKPKYITLKDGETIIPFTGEDKSALERIITELRTQNGIVNYINRYIEEAMLVENKGGFTYSGSEELKKEMRLLKTVVKYLRIEGKIGRNDFLAKAMIDEVIEYIVQHPLPNEENEKDSVYRASIVVANATDSEIREQYKLISQDKEWKKLKSDKVENPHNRSMDERVRKYPIQLTKREQDELTKDPDKILQIK